MEGLEGDSAEVISEGLMGTFVVSGEFDLWLKLRDNDSGVAASQGILKRNECFLCAMDGLRFDNPNEWCFSGALAEYNDADRNDCLCIYT